MPASAVPGAWESGGGGPSQTALPVQACSRRKKQQLLVGSVLGILGFPALKPRPPCGSLTLQHLLLSLFSYFEV